MQPDSNGGERLNPRWWTHKRHVLVRSGEATECALAGWLGHRSAQLIRFLHLVLARPRQPPAGTLP